jgi:hypothetical protein
MTASAAGLELDHLDLDASRRAGQGEQLGRVAAALQHVARATSA